MSQKYTKPKQSVKHTQNSRRNYYLLPLLFIGFIPLIVYYRSFHSPLGDYPWYDTYNAADIFLSCKSTAFIAVNAVMAFLLGLRIYWESKQKSSAKRLVLSKMAPVFIPLAVYGLLALISTIVSDYSYYGFHGIQDQFEPVWALLGYCLTAYYAFLFIQTEEDVRTVFRWLLTAAGILGIIGVFQAFSIDFYQSSFGQSLFLPSDYLKYSEPLIFNFEPGRVYTSLYNPNYVGTFVGLLVPLLLVLVLFSKQIKLTLSYIALLIILLICLFGSQSRSGIIAVAASLFFMLFLFRNQLLKHWKPVLAGLLVLTAAFFSMNLLTNNVLLNRLTGILNEPAYTPPLSDIKLSKENVTIVYNGEPLSITFEVLDNGSDFKFTFTDQDGTLLPYHAGEEPHSYIIDDMRFSSFLTKVAGFGDTNTLGFYVRIDGTDWDFSNQNEEGTYYYYTNAMKPDTISNPEIFAPLKGRERFFSGRGFIWSRTIPLLKNHIVLGSGADTFTLVYPNDEYVQKYNYGYHKTLITRPHNMYLQIGVQTGVLSLLAFLVFYGMYFIGSLRLYFKNKFETYLSQIGAAIFAGTFGYMITGFGNDSTITVAPIFWVLIGAGLSVNYMLKTAKRNTKVS